MALKLANNARSTLAGSILAADTSLAVQPGDAGKFPALGAGDWFPATIVDAALNRENVRVTARAGAVLTIERAQEGTTAKDFAAGASLSLNVTAHTYTELRRMPLTVIDCSGNPDYPAAYAGEIYRVSVAGKVGGAAGPGVGVSNLLICLVDNSAAGDHATVGANWMRVGLGDGDVVTAMVADGAITLAKHADFPGGRVLGSPLGAEPGPPIYLTRAQLYRLTHDVGALYFTGNDEADDGFVMPYGQNLNRVTHAPLFAKYGTTYGAGDGSTTFGVQDFRGRVIAGKDNMGGTSANRLTGLTGGVDGDVLGAAGGLETEILTLAQMPVHGHTGTTGTESVDHSHATFAGAYRGLNGSGNRGWSSGDTQDGTANLSSGGRSVAHVHSFTSNNAGSGSAHNNVQPTIVQNVQIYTGVHA